MVEMQNHKLRAVIRHAYDHVPFYQRVFKGIGLQPGDIKTTADLRYIPITTKSALKNASPNQTIASSFRLSSLRTIPTSGTTGEPFTTYLSNEDLRTRQIVEFRTLLSIGFRPQDILTVIGPEWPHKKRVHQRLGLYRSTNISPAIPIEYQVRLLEQRRPTLLWAYPTVLRALLHHVDYQIDNIINPRILITSAEVQDVMLNERIKKQLDVETFNFYAANEIGRIAAECPAHEGLHVNADHVVLELVDDESGPHTQNSRTAVLTTLNMLAMPLIRYQVDDIITPLRKTCSCGCAFPLIGPPQGRSDDIIKLPGGRQVSPWHFFFEMRSIGNVDQFTLMQQAQDHFIVGVSLRSSEAADILAEIRTRMTVIFGKMVRVEVRQQPFIHDKTKKYRVFSSKLNDD